MEIDNGTILLVEDSDDDVFIFNRILNKARITNPVQVAADGQEAMDYLSGSGKFADRNRFPMPVLIFLDLKIPFVSGLEILEWMRGTAHLASIFVIVLTSSSEERDIVRSYQLGARSYLVKPPSVEALQDVIKAIQNHSSFQNFKTPRL